MKRYFFFLLFLPAVCSAIVNFQNGNYNLQFIDFKDQKFDNNFVIERNYNSLDGEGTWFGIGWNSNLATKLELLASGEIAFFENGVGPIKIFSPENINLNEISILPNLINKIVEKENLTAAAIKTLEANIKRDKVLMATYLQKYGMTNSELKGNIFKSKIYTDITILKEKNGFEVTKADNQVYKFDSKGTLTGIVFKNFDKIDLSYNQYNLVDKIKSQKGFLKLEWNSDKLLKSISNDSKKIIYEYENKKLMSSTDSDKHTYKYLYNQNGQMDQMSYPNGEVLALSYYPTNLMVKKINDSNRIINNYEYYETSTPHLIKGVKIKSDLNNMLTQVEYEYRLDSQGQKFLYRTQLKEGSSFKEVYYSSCCSQPIKIINDGLTKEMTYDEYGNLLKMVDNQGNMVSVEIDPKWNKPKKILEGKSWREYQYNEKGLVQKISISDGTEVQVDYNSKKLLSSLSLSEKNGKKKKIQMTYGPTDRFDIITFEDGEKLNYVYDNNGTAKIKMSGKNVAQKKISLISMFNKLIQLVQNPTPRVQ